MIALPTFASLQDYVSRLGDVAFWSPHIDAILQRLDLPDAGQEPVAGYNPTWSTFVCGDAVVKLFGYHAAWHRTFMAERSALSLVSADPPIVAPGTLGEGSLFDDGAWPVPGYRAGVRDGVVARRGSVRTSHRGRWAMRSAARR